MQLKVPASIADTRAGFCPGCGHGVVIRLVAEIVEEMGLANRLVMVVDVACGSLMMEQWHIDTVQAAHGRPVVTAAGIKHVRPGSVVVGHIGDGAAYSIGLAETMHAALRDDNVLALVVNNGVFGMTGGQMSPTTLLGQKTITDPAGRSAAKSGQPFDVVKALGGFDIAYLARASLDSQGAVQKAKRYIAKALQKQMNGEGFCLVEVLSACPTNWKLTPEESLLRIKNEVLPVYPTGEFVDRQGVANEN